jgi:HEAT repeat protein
MKPRLLGLLLSLSVCAAFGSIIPWGKSAPDADVSKLVAAAATHQPGDSREPFRRLEELVGQSTSNAATRDALEAGLIKLLAPSSTFEARRFACKQLGILGSKAALPALAKLLHSDDTASIACLALTTYPPGKADDTLRAAFAAAPAKARIQIIHTLGDRWDSKSVKLLAQAAGDPDRSVAEAALASLGKIGDEAAWRALAGCRKTAGPTLQPALTEAALQCAGALAASGDRKTAAAAYEELLEPSQPVYVRRAALAGLIGLDKDQGEERILNTLRGSDAALKPVAIAAVRSLRAKGASERVARELAALQPEEQVWMIDSLAAHPDPAACVAIANSLGSPNSAVRRAAITALGRTRNSSTVALLADSLGNSNDAEEHRALESALIGLGGGGETDTAVLIELKRSSGATRAALVTVLARRQGPAANPVLLEEANSPDPAVAKAAFRALTKTASATDVPALLKRLATARDAEVRAEAEGAAAQALGKIDDAASRSQAVFAALQGMQDAEVVSSLLALLPRCGDAKALAVLKAAQTDPDARVRDTAVRALAEWPDASAWDVLAGIYRRGATEAVRGLALRGLVRLAGEENAHPDAKLADRYRQLLDGARGDADLRLILGTLGGAATPDALPLALPLLANAGVRAEAEVAVKRIAEAITAQHPQAAQDALQRLKAKP